MVKIALEGFDPVFWYPEPAQKDCSENHRLAVINIAAVTKFIRAGQDNRIYDSPPGGVQTEVEGESILPLGSLPRETT